MKNLLNFFFSFDKLFKEKLVVPFFWLALIVWGLSFFATALESIALGPLATVVEFFGFFARILLALVTIRLVSELFVAIFRINDNLSPDKGRSELVDIDPVAEARQAAEAAAARTRELASTATTKTRATFDDVKTSVGDTTENLTARAKDATLSAREKTESVMGRGSVPKAEHDPTPVKILEPSAADAPKRRGRPKGSKNKPKPETTTGTASTAAPVKRGPGRPKGSTNKPKTTTAKTTTTTAKRGPGRPKGSKNKTTTAKPATKTTGAKRGPKPGTKIPRDEFGNLLKKDGTPRKKPGPKSKS